MRRTIPELIAAAFAGDPLTPADVRRLQRHMHHAARIDEILLRDGSPEDAAAETVTMTAGFQAYRAMVLRDLRRYTGPELRRLVRQQLVFLGTLLELLAGADGSRRRAQKHRQRGGQRSTVVRRTKAADIRAAVAALKASHPSLTTHQAVRRYLQDHDPEWPSATATERDKKVTAAARRLRARKNSGRVLS